jgi:hypothetical protein
MRLVVEREVTKKAKMDQATQTTSKARPFTIVKQKAPKISSPPNTTIDMLSPQLTSWKERPFNRR